MKDPVDVSDIVYCVEVARAAAYQRYFAALFAPKDNRSGLIVSLAFAAELKRIPSTSDETLLVQMRFAWLREAVAELGKGASPETPLVRAMGLFTDEMLGLSTQMIDRCEAHFLETVDGASGIGRAGAFSCDFGETLAALQCCILKIPDEPLRRAAADISAGWEALQQLGKLWPAAHGAEADWQGIGGLLDDASSRLDRGRVNITARQGKAFAAIFALSGAARYELTVLGKNLGMNTGRPPPSGRLGSQLRIGWSGLTGRI